MLADMGLKEYFRIKFYHIFGKGLTITITYVNMNRDVMLG